MTTQNRSASIDAGLLVIRVAVGIVFVFHGSQKLLGAFDGPGLSAFAGMLSKMNVPAPLLSAALAACAEFFGGLAVLTGVGLRLAAIPMIFTMIVAIVKVHSGAFSLQKNGMEYALTLGLILLGLALTGPGRLVLWRPKRRTALPAELPTPSVPQGS